MKINYNFKSNYLTKTNALKVIATVWLIVLGLQANSQVSTTTPASRCGRGPVVLHATKTTGTLKWYTVPFYGTPITVSQGVSEDGTTFTTPSLEVSTTYYVDEVDATNCSLNEGSRRVPVTATISANSIQANIFYQNTTFCTSVSTPQTVTRTGTAGGVYSYSGSGGTLSLNTSTGSITPSTSTVGTYNVTYTVTAAEGCVEEPATTTIIITTAPLTSSISYSGSPYCTTLASVTPTITNPNGGVFSATPSGLTINSATGVITPSSSLAGSYAISYFVSGAGGCAPQTATATIQIDADPVGGTTSALASEVSSGGSTVITLNGSLGSVQWQSSTDNSTYADISGATGLSYTTPALTSTTYYRAVVTNGVCSGSKTSTVTTVAVSAASVAGTVTLNDSHVCYGNTTGLSVSGYVGNIQWQRNNSGSWVDINGETSSTSTTTALNTNTSYRVIVTNGLSAPAVSNEVTVTIDPTSVGGTTFGSTICQGQSANLFLSEYVGTIQWQKKASGSWEDINGATSDVYTTPNLTTTTLYRAKLTSGVCSEAFSNEAEITVDPTSVGGTATATVTTLCSGGATTVTLTGYTGTIQWQNSENNLTWADIKGENGAIYTTPTLTATTYYRATVTSGVCSSSNSSVATVTVVGDPTLAQPANASMCAGGNITLTTSVTGGTGTYSYQWKYSADGSTNWTDVADGTPSHTTYSGATSTSLTITGDGSETAQNNYYKCVLVTNTPSGCGCNAETSSVTVTSTPDPSWATITSPATSITYGSSVTFSATVSYGLGGAISWIRSTTSGGNGVTVTSPDSPTAVGTYYYRPHYAPTGSGCNLSDGTETAVTVTAKELTVTGLTGDNKEYDGNTTATATGTAALSGVINSDVVTLGGTPAYTFTDANVANGITIKTTGYSISGAQSGNYTLTQPTLSGNITAKALTAASTVADKVYNGSATAGTITLGSITGLVGSETLTITTSASDYSDANVGTGKSTTITYTLAGNTGTASNYSMATKSVTGTITKKALSITSPTIASKVYDGKVTTGALTVGTLSGFVESETVTVTAEAANYTSANIGTYDNVVVTYTLHDVTGSNAGLASNYSLANGSATGVIEAKPLTITANNYAKGYGETLTSPTTGSTASTTSTLLISGDVVSSVTTTYLDDVGTATKTVGTYTSTIKPSDALGSGLSNYSITYSSGTMTINKIIVTATVGSLRAGYDTLDAAFAAINHGTHKGTITVTIHTDLSGTNPTLNASGISDGSGGSASYTSVTIEAATGVTISGGITLGTVAQI
ncbi:MAG: YDG domain-containing protein [Prolixibacteraceae bacterium]|nr:YDG domain-containing protein [Prolixibacteraceae bacterium]